MATVTRTLTITLSVTFDDSLTDLETIQDHMEAAIQDSIVNESDIWSDMGPIDITD